MRARLRRARPWCALVLGVAALLCALVAAHGPARYEHAEVSWPAPDAAASTVDESARPALWYSPLLLSAHTAERLQVDLPCAVATGDTPALLFATTRQADKAWGLRITGVLDTLTVKVGGDTLTTVPWAATVGGCDARFEFDDTVWRLSRDGVDLASGDHGAPAVSGFYTEVAPDAAGHSTVHAELTTRTYSSTPSPRQIAFTVLAVVFALLAVGALARAPQAGPRLVRPRVRPLDGGVLAALVAWWALAPWFYDDGWLMATVRARRAGGSFSNYFDTLAIQMPLGFAHHMLLSPFAATDAAFLWWRLVPLLACAGTWVLLRVALANVSPERDDRLARITLAAAFLVFAFAWLMTLRPEPVVAFLSAVVLVGVLAYRRSRSRIALTVALVAAAIAATLHPSGFVAGAPLIAAAPVAWRQVRSGLRNGAEVVAAVLVGATVGILLLFADTDMARWREARAIFSQDGFHSGGVLQETLRYRDLLSNGSIPGLASVLFAAAALLSFAIAVARGRGRFAERDVAGLSLVVAALLLTTTPSKWVYHFGSGAAIATLAIAVETVRVARVTGRAGAWVRGAVVVVVALLVARSFRNPVDAQYFLYLRTAVAPALGNVLLWLGVAAVVLIATRALGRRARAGVLALAVPVGLGVIVAVTAVTFAVLPLARGPRWAMSRNAWQDAIGKDWGFGDRVEVSDPRDGKPLVEEDANESGLSTADVSALHRLPAEIADLRVFGTDVAGDAAVGELVTPWYRLPGDGSGGGIAVAVGGRMGYEGTSLDVEWLGPGDGGRDVIGRRPVIVKRNPGLVYGQQAWRLVRLSPPAGATEMRLRGHDEATDPGGHLAFSAPLTLAAPLPLSSYLDGRTALISPPELPLLHCAPPVAIRGGIAQMPGVVIGFQYDTAGREISELGSETGPWYLADDAYPTRRLWAWLTDRDAVGITVPDDEAMIGRALPADIRYAIGS